MPEESGVPLARQGVSYILFMKLAAMMTVILLTMFARGIRPGIVITILIVPLWLLAEKLMTDTDSPSLWKSIEDREEFSRLPLQGDIDKMKGARKGQKVKQAIFEGRLKEQVYYALKNEYSLSEEEIRNLDEDPEKMIKKVDNENLLEYLKNARNLNDFKKYDGEERVDIFSEGVNRKVYDENIDFEEKIKSAINELERINFVEEE
ncbi:MAG: hypothetical protein ACOC87_03590 [Candidatus Natronoplasma sp.]